MPFSNITSVPSVLRSFLYFLILILLVAPVFYTAREAFCTFENPNKIDFAKYWHKETPIPKLFVGKDNHPRFILHSIYSGVVPISSYLISIYIAKKLYP
jgi:hypothetical protein